MKNSKKITAVNVYLEARKTRTYVGSLRYSTRRKPLLEATEQPQYIFEYDGKFLYSRGALPVGPDLPLTKRVHRSKNLFRSLSDRIPSRKNAAFKEYCEETGISVNERDPLVLLTTIGRRGPSSFIFFPGYEREFGREKFKLFRKQLRLSIREFASLFGVSTATVSGIESGRVSSEEVLKKIEIYVLFPEVTLFELERSGGALNDTSRSNVEKWARAKASDS